MHRRHLLGLLDAYAERHPGEPEHVLRVRELVESNADCFRRTCLPGHVTASAFIVSADRSRFLLTHHRKLGRWLQLGGHADGEPFAHLVALREAREESGMSSFTFALPGSLLVPADVDVHLIPARKDEPEHWHHDVRFVLVAAPGQDLAISGESVDLRWFPRAEFASLVSEESLGRLGRKAWALLDDAETRLVPAD